MKKALYLMCLYVVILLLGGCQGDAQTNQFKENQIIIDSLSSDNEEYVVTKAVGIQNSMIFSIDFNDVAVQYISFWIDHYIDGEHVNSFLKISSEIFDKSDSIEYKLYFSTTELESNKEMFTLALRRNKSVSSARIEHTSLEHDSTIVNPINNIATVLNEITDLGMIVRNQGTEQVGSSDDVERTLSENKEVYVFRCMFN